MAAITGKSIKDIAMQLNERPNTVILWRDRFPEYGILGLQDRARRGCSATYGIEFRNAVFDKIKDPPPNGLSHWDGPNLAELLNVSVDAIWRLLRKEGIQLAMQRSWCVSTDPEFSEKAADIVGLYLEPPKNAIAISVDEKPSIQALSRKTCYVVTGNRKIVRGIKSTYKRNGTINLFVALEVATGQIYGKTTKHKKESISRNF